MVPQRSRRGLAIIILCVLVVAVLLAAWLILVGLWWVIAIVGAAALVYTIIEGYWKP